MASWDAFLTDTDKEVLKVWGKTKLNGFGEHPALMIIDDYYCVLGTERKPILESIKTWPISCGEAGWQAVDRTAELLAIAREAGIPVIHTRDLEGFPSPWQRWREPGRNSLDHLPPELRAKANQIVDEVAPIPGELVVEKAGPSAFTGTPLMFHLNFHSIDTIVVCGETTSGCVRASVVEGATYRYRMVVVDECCFDRTEASHQINLFDIHMKYGDVVDLQTAKDYFHAVGAKNKALVPA